MLRRGGKVENYGSMTYLAGLDGAVVVHVYVVTPLVNPNAAERLKHKACDLHRADTECPAEL